MVTDSKSKNRRADFGRLVADHRAYFQSGATTCTAPDYILVFKDVAAKFLKYLKETVIEFYGENPQKSPDYGRIVNSIGWCGFSRVERSATAVSMIEVIV